MKKTRIFVLLLLLSFVTVGCDFFNATTSTTTTFLTSSDKVTTSSTTTTTQTTETTTTTTKTTTQSTTTREQTDSVLIPSGYSLLQDELDVVGIPSTGDVKILVFAVDFSDYPAQNQNTTIEDIKTAFNGTSDQLTFESLQSYYDISSFGKLNISADVYGFYRASQTASYYQTEYDKYWATDENGNWLYDEDEVTCADSDLIYELLDFYDGQINYNDYDANHDGYIDGIYVLYTHPVSYESGSDLWWAYTDVYAYMNDKFDGIEPGYFVWSGNEFFEEGSDNINARTIIHETGHMLGLDDYYDYYDGDNYNSGGLGGADMMDSAYGEHNPLSKILLGWINPIVVTGSTSIDITPYIQEGNALLITKNWNGTIFDEYFLVCFYSPEGLYAPDQDYYFSNLGVEIYHVDAKIGNGYDEDSYYYTIFNNNNTDSTHKIIKLIEQDNNHEIDNSWIVENSDLFYQGDVFSSSTYSEKWYNNSSLGFSLTISSITSEKATISVNFDN